MARLILLALLVLSAAPTSFSRTVDSPIEDVELENVETFGEVEKKLDKLFDTFDDVIAERTERISNGETPNDDSLNEKLFEVIEDAEDLDDDITDLVDNLDNEDDENEFEDDEDKEDRERRINDDLEIMQSDATLLVSDARHLVKSINTNPDGSRKATSDPIIKVEMENVKDKAEEVLKALKKSEKKIKRKRKRAKSQKGEANVLDDDMYGAQADIYIPSRSILYGHLGREDPQPSPPPEDDVIDVGSSPSNTDTGNRQPDPRFDNSPNGDTGSRQPDPGFDNSPNGDTGNRQPDPRFDTSPNGDAGSRQPDPRFDTSSNGDTGSRQPDPRFDNSPNGDAGSRQPDPRFDTSSNGDTGNGQPGDPPNQADMDPVVRARLEARRLELERQEVRRRLEMARAAATAPPPTPVPRSVRQSGRSLPDNSRNPYSPSDFDETFGRSNRQYFNVDGLESYLDECTNCVGMSQQTTCPLNSQVLELKKWANELQELLSFGCKKPESCTLPGICCVKDKYPFEQTVVQMTQMMKDVYNLLQDRCSRGCFGDGGGPDDDNDNRDDDDDDEEDNNNGAVLPLRRLPEGFTEVNWTPWGSWSPCDVTCGQGIRERRRTCPQESNGRFCEGDSVETEVCDERPCCVDGNWTPWSSWSTCSATCGQGVQEKTRTCTDPSPNHCGQTCQGRGYSRQFCEGLEDCCVDGNWASWSRWSQCSVTCGQGVSTRNRGCTAPSPNHCGERCDGDRQETRPCGNAQECCVNGNWGTWNSWTSCSVSCGRGTKSRMRRCDNPSSNFCGRTCVGSALDTAACDEGMCCVDGNWGSWGSWESCSTTCGTGNQLRRRYCNSPSRNSCGQPCPGNPAEVRDCNEGSCCVDGKWGTWQGWSQCSATCGVGTLTRTRACDSPAPDWCGQQCPGRSLQRDSCNTGIPCQVCVDGNWGTWDAWSTCSASCGQGLRGRSRECDRPRPNFCGMECLGSAQDMERCDSGITAVDGNWGTWTSWSACSASCGMGQRERMRSCDRPSKNACGRACPGEPFQVEDCDDGPCINCDDVRWSTWATWSRCSATCGTGLRKRTRDCYNPYPADCNDQNYCRGPETDEEPCGSGVPCCDDVRWSTWATWSRCSATCGTGLRKRTRDCYNPYPADCNDQNYCRGPETDEEPCGSGVPCCDDVRWSTWATWSRCSATCGTGLRKRTRDCYNPYPADCNDQNYCRGPETDEESCGSGVPCCDDVRWSTWSVWSACSSTCGTGVSERARTCLNAKTGCEESCQGPEMENQPCTNMACCDMVQWTSWSRWASCSVSCGRGVQERMRDCINPFPGLCSDDACDGMEKSEKSCDTGVPCCVDGNWNSWSLWSRCSVTCGFGTIERHRVCDNPPRNSCGQDCPGLPYESDLCEMQPCITCVDGNWGLWEAWSSCSVTCGGGSRERRRHCNNPPANNCGQECEGREYDTDSCNNHRCAPDCVDGNWGSWANWSPCPVTCGRAIVERFRLCDSPAPNDCGAFCQGQGVESTSRLCGPFAVNGNWSPWSSWSICSTSCGSGQQIRSRLCNSPPVNACGETCPGRDEEITGCEERPCEECAMRQWTEWGRWGSCSETCGFGMKARYRYCEFSTYMEAGQVDCGPRSYENCLGGGMEEDVCTDLPPCPGPSQWTSWGACSLTCRGGYGFRERVLMVMTPDGRFEADDTRTEREPCSVDSPECPTWGPWGPCSATCRGMGQRERSQYIRTPLGTLEVDASQVQTETCQVDGPECPPSLEWGSWGACSVTCKGVGVRERRIVFRTDLGSLPADTNQVQREQCQVSEPECPSWGPWSPCSSTCRGEGVRERRILMRTNLGSLVSDSSRVETEDCPTFGPACAGTVGSWGQWEKWCPCDCRTGKRSRRRECQRQDEVTREFVTVSLTLCPGQGREEKSCDVDGICPECITTCQGQSDGVYASCSDCADFIRCQGGEGENNMMRCSKPNTHFDGFVGKCVTAPSPSCSLEDCITDCRDQNDGDYHSCSNCSSFIHCESGLTEEISCPDSTMEFNGHFDTCMGTRSPTCKRSRTVFRSTSSTGVMVNDAPADEYYDEIHGLNAEERREMYEKTRKKTAAELREMAEEEEKRMSDENPFDIELLGDLDEEETIEVVEGGFFDRVKDFVTAATGTGPRVPDCVTSCEGLKGGRYPSCKGCEFYLRCYNNGSSRHKECINNKKWDDKAKRCRPISSTCPGT